MSNFTRLFFAFILLAFLVPVKVTAQSTIFNVAKTGGDFTSIHDAVNSALVTDGDILIVSADTFTEGSTYIMDKALTIRGQGPGQTVIQAADSAGKATSRKFTVLFDSLSTKEMVFENLTIKNGYHPDETGGAIYQYFGTLTIRNCEFIDNYASVKGGAIFVEYGNIQCFNTTFSGNKTINPFVYYMYGGGAVAYQEYDGTQLAYFENCTFVNNSAASYGGALNGYMPTEIVNSTFTGNSAKVAGGFFSSGYDLYLTNTIVAGNSADSLGNDIHQDFFANYCLFQDTATGIIIGDNNIIGADPGLLPLAMNGGITRTCAIPFSSMAKDKGTQIDAPVLDQRGATTFNYLKDIGAYEFNVAPQLSLSRNFIDTTTVLYDSLQISYLVTAENFIDTLKIESDDAGVSADPEGDFGQRVNIIPDINGNIDEIIYMRFIPESRGNDTLQITHIGTLVDTLLLEVVTSTVCRPVGENDSVLMTENATFTFAEDNFSYSDADGDPVDGIIITSPVTAGSLSYDGEILKIDTLYKDFGLITFNPDQNESGMPYASFGFMLADTAGYISDEYVMTVFVNGYPVVQNAISDDNTTTETVYTSILPANTFADPQTGQALTWTVTLSDDSDLPEWLEFDAETRTLSGTPVDAGTLAVKVTATDPYGLQVSDEFTLTITLINHAPVVANPIPDDEAQINVEYSYIIPGNTFTDSDGNTLAYSATLSDGSTLPSWLSFDDETRVLSGTSEVVDTIVIRISASDGIADPVYDDFVLTIVDPTSVHKNLYQLIRVYPNPTAGKIYIQPAGRENLEISVLNLSGTTITKQRITGEKSEINLTSYPKGIYLLKVSDGKQEYVQQIVLQ